MDVIEKKKNNLRLNDKVWLKLWQITSIDRLIPGKKVYNGSALGSNIAKYQVNKKESTKILCC